MSKPRPDPEQLADAVRRAAFQAEHIPGRANTEGERILAFDTLLDFIADTHQPEDREQIAWALLWADDDQRQHERPFEEHELRMVEDAWKKVREDAEQQEWERLGLENP